MDKLIRIYILVLISAAILFAQPPAAVTVEQIDICTAIENRIPVGADTAFAANVGQLYCFTKLNSAQDTTVIKHVWFYNNRQMAEVDLTMKAKSWRTWSSKTIAPEWKGDWQVEIQNAAGDIIDKKSFIIR